MKTKTSNDFPDDEPQDDEPQDASFHYSLPSPSSSFASSPPPASPLHDPANPSPIKRGGHAQESTQELRQSVSRWLEETGIHVLQREAKRIRTCCEFPAFSGAPNHLGKQCRSVFCPACSRRRAKKARGKVHDRIRLWRSRNFWLAHFVVSLRHRRTDQFSTLADAVLEVYAKLRRSAWFMETFPDYRHAIHCRYTKKGPHPHVHILAPVAKDPSLSKDRLAEHLGGGAYDAISGIVRRTTRKTLRDIRAPGRIVVAVIPETDLDAVAARLGSYAVKASKTNPDDLAFGQLSPRKIEDLFYWLGGNRSRHRRLNDGSRRPL